MNFSQKIFLPELSIRRSKWKILSEINPNKSINFKRYHSPIPYTHIYIKSQRIKVKSKKCSCHIQPYFSISFLTFFAIHPSIHPSAFLFPSRISVNSKPNWGDAKKQIALQESLCSLYPPQFHTG